MALIVVSDYVKVHSPRMFFFFFFNDTATTEIYTLSLHDALPIYPEVTKLRAALDHRIGEVQLPEVILAVDAQVRFSWIMLGREPRSTAELLMVYAGIMAHGTSLTAIECARMRSEEHTSELQSPCN